MSETGSTSQHSKNVFSSVSVMHLTPYTDKVIVQHFCPPPGLNRVSDIIRLGTESTYTLLHLYDSRPSDYHLKVRQTVHPLIVSLIINNGNNLLKGLNKFGFPLNTEYINF